MTEEKVIDGEYVYRILIVDDEKEVQNALKMTLERTRGLSCEVETADNGEQALVKLEKGSYDLVISDYKMPGINGVELLSRARDRNPEIVRMLITGYSSLDVAREAINRADVDNYIEKPWDNDDLRAVVMSALVRKRGADVIKKVEVDDVKTAIEMVKEFQRYLLKMDPKNIVTKRPKIMCEFRSVREFNLFSFEIKKMDNADIDDIIIQGDKFIITVNVYPSTFTRIL